MKVLLDTSVLVAAMLPDHVHHAQARGWLAQTRTGSPAAVVSGHTLAELYAVLTRLPRKPLISPGEALQLIQENVTSHATVATLSGEDYIQMVKELARAGVAGGAVYDAVIARAAERANVDHLVTLNVGHFHRVWPAGASRVVSPLTMGPPQ
jgi:predicted nucleic acid-binding protein